MPQNIEAGETNRPIGAAGAARHPIGAEGAQLKQEINEAKKDVKTEKVDLGASMLGTDNEAGSAPDHDAMAEARNAPPPK